MGSYQYGHPSMDVKVATGAYLKIVEAQHAAPPNRLRHVIDMESLSMVDGRQVVPATAGAWTDAWCEIIKYETGTEPIIYASLYYFEEMCKEIATLGGAAGWDWGMVW